MSLNSNHQVLNDGRSSLKLEPTLLPMRIVRTEMGLKLWIIAAISMLVAGCSTTPSEPRFSFSKYEGKQKLWAIDEPTYAVLVVDGIEYYTGDDVPSKFHIIIGRISGATPDGLLVARKEIAALARAHGADGFIEGKTATALGGRVIAIEGNVFKYVPEFILNESEFAETLSAVLWCIENRDGGVLEGKAFDAEVVEAMFERFSQMAAARLDTYVETGR